MQTIERPRPAGPPPGTATPGTPGADVLLAAIGPHRGPGGRPEPDPVLEVVVPVYDEEGTLRRSVERLHAHLADGFPYPWRITVVDNASTDRTWEIAVGLVGDLDRVAALRLRRKGRGLALRTAWLRSRAEVVAYMDVDLSTGLDALLPLVAPLLTGHSDVAIGSRLAPGARVARGPRRELISRSYNALLRTLFAAKVHDAQCGFKAVRAEVARRLVPEVVDDGWFFDTELLLLADHNGLRVHELPVDWVDDPDSRVRVVRTALGDLAGSARMAGRFLGGGGDVDLGPAERPALRDDHGRRLVALGLIGAASTAVSLALFLALLGPLGAVPANLLALGATFGANAWARARVSPGRRRVRWGPALGALGAGAALSTGALLAARALDAGRPATVAVLLASWVLTSLGRLALLERGNR